MRIYGFQMLNLPFEALVIRDFYLNLTYSYRLFCVSHPLYHILSTQLLYTAIFQPHFTVSKVCFQCIHHLNSERKHYNVS